MNVKHQPTLCEIADRPTPTRPAAFIQTDLFVVNKQNPTTAPPKDAIGLPALMFSNQSHIIKYNDPLILPVSSTPEIVYKVVNTDEITGKIQYRIPETGIFPALACTTPLSSFYVGTRAGHVHAINYRTRTESNVLRAAGASSPIVQIVVDDVSRRLYVRNAESKVCRKYIL